MTPASLSFLRSLTAAATAMCCSLVAAAGAHANSIVWDSPADLAPASVSPFGEDVIAVLPDSVLAAPDGSVLVMWAQSESGHVRIRARRRSPAGEWSAPDWVSTAGVDLAGAFATTDDDSNFTIGWIDTTYTPSAKTLLHDESAWPEDAVTISTLEGSGGESLTGGAIARGPDGTVIVVYSEVSDPDHHRIRTVTRAKNSHDWTRGLDREVPSNEYPIGMKLSVNTAGDATVLWTRDDGNKDLRASQRPAGSPEWSDPQTIVENVGGSFEYLGLASGPGDDAAVMWQSGDLHINFTTFDDAISDGPDDPSVPPVALNTHDPDTDAVQTAVLPNIASNGDGRYTVVFQRYPVTPQAFARTRAVDGTWSDPVVLTGAIAGGAPKVASNPRGDVLAVFSYTLDGSTMLWGSSLLASGSETWTPPATIGLGNDLDLGNHGLLSAGIDDSGNTAFAFPKPVDGHWEVGFAAGDGAGPVFAAPDIPASGTVGDDLSFVSGTTYDLRSALAETTWDFGDGGSATGSAPQHKYTAPGTYSVTVTATDAVGNSTERTGTVVIVDAEQPPVERPVPPKNLQAPIIEARLARKTITLNVVVSLRAGKKCNGKERGVKATTVFGTVTYRTTLKLGLVGGVCRGTGTIVLRKTPGARTKLKVVIGGKSSKKDRPLTTKRG